MESFTITEKTKYRDIKIGDTINLKRKEDNQTIITLNKGKKEYILPNNYLNYLKILSQNDITMESLFIVPEKSYCIGMHGVKNHFDNFTELGKILYESHFEAEDFIQRLTHL